MPAAENKNRVLLVCGWRHGGHVGGQEQKRLSPLGTKLHFHDSCNWILKQACVLQVIWARKSGMANNKTVVLISLEYVYVCDNQQCLMGVDMVKF